MPRRALVLTLLFFVAVGAGVLVGLAVFEPASNGDPVVEQPVASTPTTTVAAPPRDAPAPTTRPPESSVAPRPTSTSTTSTTTTTDEDGDADDDDDERRGRGRDKRDP